MAKGITLLTVRLSAAVQYKPPLLCFFRWTIRGAVVISVDDEEEAAPAVHPLWPPGQSTGVLPLSPAEVKHFARFEALALAS